MADCSPEVLATSILQQRPSIVQTNSMLQKIRTEVFEHMTEFRGWPLPSSYKPRAFPLRLSESSMPFWQSTFFAASLSLSSNFCLKVTSNASPSPGSLPSLMLSFLTLASIAHHSAYLVSICFVVVFFWVACHAACRILVPRPGNKPLPSAVEVWPTTIS